MGGTTKYLSLVKAAVPRRFQPEVLRLLNEYVLRSELSSAMSEAAISTIVMDSSGAPSNPAEGQFYYDSVAHKLKVYTGSAWETVTSS